MKTSKRIDEAAGGWPQITEFVLRRKRDGWFVSPGSHHTSSPRTAIILRSEEVAEWLAEFGSGYEAVKLNDAQEVA